MSQQYLRDMIAARAQARRAEEAAQHAIGRVMDLERALATAETEQRRTDIALGTAVRDLAELVKVLDSEQIEAANAIAHRDGELRALKAQLRHLLGRLHAVPRGSFLDHDEIAEIIEWAERAGAEERQWH